MADQRIIFISGYSEGTPKITYNANGGVTAPPVDTVLISGMDWSLSGPATWDNNHKFLGWSENRNATSPSFMEPGYAYGVIRNCERDYEVFAVWEDNTPQEEPTYTISAVVSPSGAGSVAGTGEFVQYATTRLVATSNDATTTFDHWEKDGVNLGSSYSLTVVVEASATYTAFFNVPDAWIIYNVGAGRPEIETQYYDSEIGTLVSSTIPVYSGHIFLGWSTSASATSANIRPGQTFRDGYAGAHNLYAVWSDQKSGSIEDIEQIVSHGEPPEEGEVATITATWTIDSYVPGDINCSGTIDWDITLNAGNEDYDISKIVFYSGSTRLGDAYTSSGAMSSVTWDINHPPSKMIVYWVQDVVKREFSVSVEDESGPLTSNTPEEDGCSAKILPVDADEGRFSDGTVITLVATEGTDWEFVKWTRNGTDMSTDKNYNIVVSEDNAGAYVAIFKNLKATYHLSIEVKPSNATNVTVTGDGDYHIGDIVSLEATGNADFEFKYWKLKGYDYPGDSEKSDNPYEFKLNKTLVSMSMEWLAVFKQTTYYTVIGRVNNARGLLTLNPLKAGYNPDEPLELIVSTNSQYQDHENYACLHLDSSSGVKIKNEHLAFGSLVAGFTHSYNVNEDNVWTAYFEKILVANLYLDYNPLGPEPSQPEGHINIFAGERYDYAQPLPTPVREGYYFKGWFTARDNTESYGEEGEKIENSTQVSSSISDSIKLYAHWESLNTKYFITGEVNQPSYFTVKISGSEHEDYFVAGETCTIEVERNADNPTAENFVWNETLYYDGNINEFMKLVDWFDNSSGGPPMTFVVGADSKWESDGDNAGEKKIRFRFDYIDLASAIYVEVVPSDHTLGNALSDKARVTETAYATITAYPKTELDAAVAKWEKKIGNGSWEKLDNQGNTLSVQGVVESENGHRVAQSIFIRVTFGRQGTLTYDLQGGSPAIPEQHYTRGGTFTLSDAIPTKSGYVFVGWSDSPTSAISYQPGDSATFTDATKTIYAIWYETPQTLENIRHYDVTTKSDYSGEQATVSAQVIDITRTGTAGTLQGKLTWTVTMPSGGSASQGRFSKICVGSTGLDDILTSEDENNTEGTTVTFPYTTIVKTAWTFTVCYVTGEKQYAYFDANGGEGAPEAIEIKNGESFKIPDTIPTKSGYVFKGWANEADAAHPSFQPGQTISVTSDDDIFFYAVWSVGITISIVHHNNTTGQDSDTPLSTARVWVTEEDKKVHWDISNVKSGYELVPSGTIGVTDSMGTLIGQGSGTTGEFVYHNTSENPDNNWTATIYYTQDNYVITYDTQGGTPEVPQQTVSIDRANAVKISTIRPKKGNDEFLGWAESASAAEATYAPGAVISITGNTWLYAVYREDSEGSEGSDTSPGEESFTVYGRPDSVANGTVTPAEKSYKEGDEVSFTASATEGHKFAFWVDAAGGAAISTDATYTFTATSEEDGHTYIAVFVSMDENIPSDLIYYVPTDLLMSYRHTLVWNDDGLKGCGD